MDKEMPKIDLSFLFVDSNKGSTNVLLSVGQLNILCMQHCPDSHGSNRVVMKDIVAAAYLHMSNVQSPWSCRRSLLSHLPGVVSICMPTECITPTEQDSQNGRLLPHNMLLIWL